MKHMKFGLSSSISLLKILAISDYGYPKYILPPSQNMATSSIQILSHNIATFEFPSGVFGIRGPKYPSLHAN